MVVGVPRVTLRGGEQSVGVAGEVRTRELEWIGRREVNSNLRGSRVDRGRGGGVVAEDAADKLVLEVLESVRDGDLDGAGFLAQALVDHPELAHVAHLPDQVEGVHGIRVADHRDEVALRALGALDVEEVLRRVDATGDGGRAVVAGDRLLGEAVDHEGGGVDAWRERERRVELIADGHTAVRANLEDDLVRDVQADDEVVLVGLGVGEVEGDRAVGLVDHLGHEARRQDAHAVDLLGDPERGGRAVVRTSDPQPAHTSALRGLDVEELDQLVCDRALRADRKVSADE